MAFINMRCVKPLVAAWMVTASGAALAQAANVNVTGNIIGGCSVTTGATTALAIGDVPANSFAGAGATSALSPTQNIVLTCAGNPGVSVTMSGTQASGAPNTVLALTGAGSEGIATGVGVQILVSSQGAGGAPFYPMPLDGTALRLPSGATVTLPVAARYYAITANPGAGTGNTTATLNFRFN